MRAGTLRRIAIQAAVSLACITLLLWQTNLGELRRVTAGVQWPLIGLAVLFVTASQVMHGLRWWLLVRRTGPVPLSEAVLLLLAATGISVLLPLRAGALLQIQVLQRRHGIPRAVVVGTLMAEGLVDAILLLGIAILAVPLLGLGGRVLRTSLVVAAAAAAIAALVMLLGRLRPGAYGAGAPGALRTSINRLLASVARGLATVGGPGSFALLLVPTLGDWAMAATAHWLVGTSYAITVPVYAYLGVEIVGNLVGAVPLTQANVGPFDLAVQQTLALFGANAAQAAAFAIVTHATIILAEFSTGLLAAWLLHLRAEDVLARRHEADAAEGGNVS